jgi:gliding motility-associated-like protein
MNKILKYPFLILLFLTLRLYATHNRAGEITYRHLYGNTYEIKIVTYTDPNSPADRPELEVKYSCGTTTHVDSVERDSIVPTSNPSIQRNVYITTFTFTGACTWTISVTDPNRNAGIVNIPNSVEQPFYIETKLVINGFLGINNSPVLYYPPIDNGCIYQIYQHNPVAYDPDGDSLAYSLVACKGYNGNTLPGYTFPQASNSLTIDANGTMTWNTPVMQGEFNVAILITEYRNGYIIGSVLRDMQITIGSCTNQPPVFNPLQDICVRAGDLINVNISASDPNGDNCTITALTSNTNEPGSNNPFAVSPSPAVFNPPASPAPSVTGQFIWQTQCEHVSKKLYKAVFKANDLNSANQLVTFTALKIQVIGHPPDSLWLSPNGVSIEVKWSKDRCQNVVKYLVYRKNGPTGYIPAYCETGMPSSLGYTLIGETNSWSDTTFLDDNNGIGLNYGETYCYRIVAVYPDGAESYISKEVCTNLKFDVPLITNVSVINTDATSGSIYLRWMKPTEHDTLAYPGPYKYLIYRADGKNGSNYVLVDSTLSINDTTYIDNNLNTKDSDYNYRLTFVDISTGNNKTIGNSTKASSVFINATPGDNKVILTWDEWVPWHNDSFTVFRFNPVTTVYDSLTTVYQRIFVDTGLNNGTTYCYKIKTKGSYTIFNNYLENYSQEICAIPIDNEPPCSPEMNLYSNCNKFENIIQWNNPNKTCADDVLGYELYFMSQPNGDYQLLATFNSANDTFFVHSNAKSIAGCYTIAAIDSAGNKSAFADSICVDNCPEYQLPNIFTPGNNGMNDLLKPFPYRFVESIDIKIYNRWGTEVFHTTNPDILWDGTSQVTGQPCSDGVYYYVCIVNEIYFEGIKSRVLTGYIQLLRDK